MRFYIITWVFVPLLLLACNGISFHSAEAQTTTHQYQDFIFNDKIICALTKQGEIVVINLENGKLADVQLDIPFKITHIAQDKNGNIVFCDTSNTIKQINKTSGVITQLAQSPDKITGILFDNENHLFLINTKGITDVTRSKSFFPDKMPNYQLHHMGEWGPPDTYIMDKENNIWLGFGHGEWGGELFIFSTREQKFIEPDINGFVLELNPIKSIFEGNDKIYITSGLMHFETQGCIAEFSNFKARVILESESYSTDKVGGFVQGEYIGPGAYNEKEKCIYFYSQHGIFKGNPDKDLSIIEKWEKVLDPKLQWSNGQTNAVGSPMNVLKLNFTNNNTMVFITQNDGIGIYDGNKLMMTQ
jgi:hypothetical protein